MDADLIFLDADQTLQLRDAGLSRCQVGRRTGRLQRVADATLKALRKEIEGRRIRLRALSRDLELKLQAQQLEIGPRQITSQAEHDAPAGFVCRKILGPSRLVHAADPLPDIGLPRGSNDAQKKSLGAG